MASKAESLAADKSDLWDSGKVLLNASIQVEYAGKPLNSSAACFWKVRIWDRDGRPAAWSQPASWSMGLLKAEDWHAKWIGQDIVSDPLEGAKWIWTSENDAALNAPVGVRWFRRTLVLPADGKVLRAVCRISADNAFELFINGKKVGQGDNFNNPMNLDATTFLHPGANVLAVAATNAGDAPNPAGSIASLRVTFAQGEPLVLTTDERWKANLEKQKDWQDEKFDDSRSDRARRCWGPMAWGRGESCLPMPTNRDRSRPVICGGNFR